jgi:transposase
LRPADVHIHALFRTERESFLRDQASESVILSTGCQWRAIPKDLPARSTLYDYFDLWSFDGTLDRLHDALYVKCREQASRDASPTAAILDSQSVKSAEKGVVSQFES